ncbi:alkanesulfonate monooxygenase [Streptomyces alboflavus]|uniref:Alkanesulfonate monooxygenase n=1 Tax=Streptomyces alboflavus TaxID=67267 RepID=A0A1Z1WQR9_9ACTN|nr:alkanesulfonate monooxygenase [Streptomyces alboflavus]
MTVHLHWFLPTGGDGRTLVDRHAYTDGGITRSRVTPVSGVRAPDIEYLAQIAKAAEQLGFEAVLTPTGTWCEDAWLTTVALAQHTERLKFLVAFRPGVISPVLAAQMAATYQRITRGRLLLNVVTGGDSTEQRRFGDHVDHDRRYARTDEFLSVVRGVWSGRPYDFEGEHYRIDGGLTALPPDPLPEIFFGGSSAAAGPVAARHSDVYLTWGEPPEQVKKKIDWIRGLAEAEGRTVRFRDPPAHHLAGLLRRGMGHRGAAPRRPRPGHRRRRPGGARPQRVGRPAAHARAARRLTRRPGDLPQPVGGRRVWCAAARARARGQPRRGRRPDRGVPRARIEHFVLSGYPHLEEAYWFGEGVPPTSRRAGCCPASALPADRRPGGETGGPRPLRAARRSWWPGVAEQSGGQESLSAPSRAGRDLGSCRS